MAAQPPGAECEQLAAHRFGVVESTCVVIGQAEHRVSVRTQRIGVERLLGVTDGLARSARAASPRPPRATARADCAAPVRARDLCAAGRRRRHDARSRPAGPAMTSAPPAPDRAPAPSPMRGAPCARPPRRGSSELLAWPQYSAPRMPHAGANPGSIASAPSSAGIACVVSGRRVEREEMPALQIQRVRARIGGLCFRRRAAEQLELELRRPRRPRSRPAPRRCRSGRDRSSATRRASCRWRGSAAR